MPEPILKVSAIILSPAILYGAPLGTAMPANSVPFGGSWGSSWFRVGLTSAPLKMGYMYEVAEADVQEALAPVNRKKKSEKASFETVMAETNLNLLPYAWDGAVAEVAAGGAGSGIPSSETLNIGGKNQLTQRTWAFEGFWITDAGDQLPIRFQIWRGTATAGGELEWSKEKFIGTPLKLGALAEVTKPFGQQLFQMVRITSLVP